MRKRSVRLVVAVATAGFIGLPAAVATEVDVMLGTTTRVSVRSSGAEVPGAMSWGGPISDDGRFVAFASSERFAPSDDDRERDVYLRDLVGATTRIVSLTDDEQPITRDVDLVGMTNDARLVFLSVPTVGYDTHRVVVRDLVAGTTRPVVGGVYDAGVSSDGSWLAYTERTLDDDGLPVSTRLRLLEVATRSSVPVFRTGRALWAYSVADTGDVAFDTDAVVVPGGGGGRYEMDVFVWTRASATIELLSGDLPGFQNQTPTITRDGAAVAFWTDAGQLGDSGYAVWTRGDASEQVVVVPTESEFMGNSAILTPDGRYLAYTGEAYEGGYETPVMVLDRATGVIERVDVNDFGRGSISDSRSGVAAITPDGRYVSFTSLSDELVPADMSGSFDVFVRDRHGAPTGTGAPDLLARTRGQDRVTGGGDIDPLGSTDHQLWSVEPGSIVIVYLGIRNLGNAQERFTLVGHGSRKGMRISYWVGDEDVTDLVVAGTYRTPLLPPVTKQLVRMRVAVAPDAACVDRSFALRATSQSSAWTDALSVFLATTCDG